MKCFPPHALALALSLFASAANAHEGHQEQGAATPAESASTAGADARPAAAPGQPGAATRDAQAYFTDTELLTQDGKPVRFYSDVLKDRVVLLNVVFTHCDDACPLLTRKLKEVRDAMGKEAASEVYFISLSVDPLNDTPQALKAFAKKNGADDPNWLFLTGDKANIDLVLQRLGHLVDAPEQHSTLLIAGDVANKRWSKIRPDAPAPAIAQRLQLLSMPVAGR